MAGHRRHRRRAAGTRWACWTRASARARPGARDGARRGGPARTGPATARASRPACSAWPLGLRLALGAVLAPAEVTAPLPVGSGTWRVSSRMSRPRRETSSAPSYTSRTVAQAAGSYTPGCRAIPASCPAISWRSKARSKPLLAMRRIRRLSGRPRRGRHAHAHDARPAARRRAPWPSSSSCAGASTARSGGLPEPEAGLAAGILVGLRERVAARSATTSRRPGLTHVVAISGWNIALVAGIATEPAARRRAWRGGRAASLVMVAIAGVHARSPGPRPASSAPPSWAASSSWPARAGDPPAPRRHSGLACWGLLLADPAWSATSACSSRWRPRPASSRSAARPRLRSDATPRPRPALVLRDARCLAGGPAGDAAAHPRPFRPAVAHLTARQPAHRAGRATGDAGRRRRRSLLGLVAAPSPGLLARAAQPAGLAAPRRHDARRRTCSPTCPSRASSCRRRRTGRRPRRPAPLALTLLRRRPAVAWRGRGSRRMDRTVGRRRGLARSHRTTPAAPERACRRPVAREGRRGTVVGALRLAGVGLWFGVLVWCSSRDRPAACTSPSSTSGQGDAILVEASEGPRCSSTAGATRTSSCAGSTSASPSGTAASTSSC